jgi:hypothetical protein
MRFLRPATQLILTIVLLFACAEQVPDFKGTPEYIADIKQWHQQRIERLKKDNGWLNLVGLYWLQEGANSFGSSKDNDIQFPLNSPDWIGIFFLNDGIVSMKINNGINVTANDIPVKELELKTDSSGEPTILELGSLQWHIINRGDNYGIRLRDLKAPLVKEFKGIDTYPINSDWRFEAGFETYDPPKEILIPNILGTTEEDFSPGAIVFKMNGNEYKLDAIESSSGYFIIFADETSGEETYGAGRFLYTGRKDSLDKVILDFNKAYNPPCVFTKFATCPLPPKQNYLQLRITAGEKMWGEQH